MRDYDAIFKVLLIGEQSSAKNEIEKHLIGYSSGDDRSEFKKLTVLK